MKDFIVVFSDRGARIIKGVNAADWQGVAGVAVNPDLGAVKGIPPHHWRLVDSKVVPKPDAERTDPNPKTMIEHTIQLDPDFLKPHLDAHLQRHRLKTLLYCGMAALVVSGAVSFVAHLIR
jgi:hypothetical protein